MAFGAWMKRIASNVKSFGKKVKGFVQKALPTVEKGLETINKYAKPVTEVVGNLVGGDRGQKIRDAGDKVTTWTDKERTGRFIKPIYNFAGGDDDE